MKYELILSGRFKKSLKSDKKRGLDISLLDSIVEKLLLGFRSIRNLETIR